MNKEQRKKYNKKYYQEHKEQIKEYSKKYNKKYYQEHKEQIKEYHKKYDHEHKEQRRNKRYTCRYDNKIKKGSIIYPRLILCKNCFKKDILTKYTICRNCKRNLRMLIVRDNTNIKKNNENDGDKDKYKDGLYNLNSLKIKR